MNKLQDANRISMPTIAILASAAVASAVSVLAFEISPVIGAWVIIVQALIIFAVLLWHIPEFESKENRVGLSLLCLSIVLGVIWPRYALLRFGGFPGISPARIAQFVLLMYWLCAVTKNRYTKNILINAIQEHRFIYIAILSLFAIKAAGVFASELPFLSAKGMVNEAISVYMPLLFTVTFARTDRDIVMIFASIIFAAVLAGVVGGYEFTVSRNVFIGILDVDSEYMRQVFSEKIRAGSYRLQSTFSHPLTFSEYLVFTTPLVLALAFGLRRLMALQLSVLALYLLATVFLVVQSGSRSGVGVLLLATAGFAVLNGLRKMRFDRSPIAFVTNIFTVMFFIGVLLLGVTVLSDMLIGKTVREFNSALVRLDMWSRGLSAVLDGPIFGYGQDMAATTLGFIEGDGNITIDSYFLSVLVESGLVGLVLYVLVVGGFVFYGLKGAISDSLFGWLSLGCSVSLICFASIKAVLSLPHNHGVAMVVAGVALVCSGKMVNVSRELQSAA